MRVMHLDQNTNKSSYKIGSCKHSDISTFSFHPLKTITTGEGGCFIIIMRFLKWQEI